MRTFIISILTFFLYSIGFAQQIQQRDENPVDLDSVNLDTYYLEIDNLLVDELPRFKGKKADFNNYISTHVVYPTEAYNRFIEGVVYISYVIDTTGKIKDAVILQSANSLLNAAALDVIMNSPKWKPASYKGKPVSFKKISKITFSR